MTTADHREAMKAFGDRQKDFLGYTVVRRDRGEIEVAWTPPPHFANPMGFVHGGFVGVLIDEIGGSALAGMLSVPSAFPTVSMHIDYLRGVPVGSTSSIVGRVVRIGRSVSFTEVEVRDATGQLCTKGAVTFALKPAEADAGVVGFAGI